MKKLKSRKFWLTIIVIAAAIIIGIRESGFENEVTTAICMICMAFAAAAYVIAEAMVDADYVAAGEITEAKGDESDE